MEASGESGTIVVRVNEREERVAPGTSVAGLVERLGLSRTACAVEVNRELVPKRSHAERVLAEGDRVEIVTLVGGG
ncbi:MAG: sulfur carrier protein ThiS [Phycisphaerales bacterium]|jgi:thiamine biosynthesis protein ThiS|nr:sulfur carrier protein ThiS [Phycisphaerales bacterium]